MIARPGRMLGPSRQKPSNKPSSQEQHSISLLACQLHDGLLGGVAAPVAGTGAGRRGPDPPARTAAAVRSDQPLLHRRCRRGALLSCQTPGATTSSLYSSHAVGRRTERRRRRRRRRAAWVCMPSSPPAAVIAASPCRRPVLLDPARGVHHVYVWHVSPTPLPPPPPPTRCQRPAGPARPLSTRITIRLSQKSLKSGRDKRFKSGHFRLHPISSTPGGARSGSHDKSCFI